jgi:hypothetical protein
MEVTTVENWLWEAACSIAGVQVLIPQGLAANSVEVQDFIKHGLSQITPPEVIPAADRLSKSDVLVLVQAWAARLGVEVNRAQLQAMRNKWGSISTAHNLTLTSNLLLMPYRLVEYVICHELLHLQVPAHNKLYRLLLTWYIPDWRLREQELGRWTLAER